MPLDNKFFLFITISTIINLLTTVYNYINFKVELIEVDIHDIYATNTKNKRLPLDNNFFITVATIIALRTTIYNYRTLMIELIEIANHQGSVSERWYV